QRLLEEPRGFTPFAKVLVDEAQVVEGGDEAIGVVDPPERRDGALQPLDRFLCAADSRAAETEEDEQLTDRAIVVGLAQHPIGVARVVLGLAIATQIDQCTGDLGNDASDRPGLTEDACDIAGFAQAAPRRRPRAPTGAGVA